MGRDLAMIPVALWLWFGAMLALCIGALYFRAKIERAARQARSSEEDKPYVNIREQVPDEEVARRKKAA